MGRVRGSTDHPLRNGTRPFADAATDPDVSRPEPAAEVGPGVDHRAEGVGPQPLLQPPLQLLARLVLLADLHVEVHRPDLLRQNSARLQNVEVIRLVGAGVFVLHGERHGQQAAVKVSQDAPELGLVKVPLLGVKGRIRVLL